MYETGLPNGLISTPVKEGHPYIILPDGHPMLRHQSIDLRDMVEEPLVLMDTPPGREYFLGLFKDAGLNPNIAFRSPSFEVVRGLVGRGVGYSILITRPRSNWTYDGWPLECRPLQSPTRRSFVGVVRTQSSHVSRVHQRFDDLCREMFAHGD